MVVVSDVGGGGDGSCGEKKLLVLVVLCNF